MLNSPMNSMGWVRIIGMGSIGWRFIFGSGTSGLHRITIEHGGLIKMTDRGITSGDIHLFRTTDGDWRVMDFAWTAEGEEGEETYYWSPSLREAMKTFGRLTARKPPG